MHADLVRFDRACAHRGGAARFPENTVLAFESAAKLGVRYIELDVHRTRDGHLVCCHDRTVDRTTNGTGPIAAQRLDELRKLDAAFRFSPDGGRNLPLRERGIRIPTLDEALDATPGVEIVIEIKPQGLDIARDVVRFLDRRREHDRVIVASFDEPTMAAVRAYSGGRLRTSAGESAIRTLWGASRVGLHRRLRLPYQAVNVPPRRGRLEVVDPRFVAATRSLGLTLFVWTINELPAMQRLLDLGADAIISDVPDLLVDELRRRGG